MRPPAEVVLPRAYYAVLFLELVGLLVLSQTVTIRAGDAIGHGIGWAGTVSMCLMHVYSIRRRVRAFSRMGAIRAWLHVHIFLGLQGAMFVTFHSIHLRSLANLSGLTLAITLVVVASGLFGRYLFSKLPKSISGERLSAIEIECELAQLRAEVDQSPEQADARSAALAAAIRRRDLLELRLTTLARAERLFRNWTLLHKPLTFLLLGAVLLHIYAHYVFAAAFSG